MTPGEAPPTTPADAAIPDAPSTGLLQEIGQLGRALRQLFGAQLHLLVAELGLARRAVSWLLVAGLVATVAGVGLGLSVLALLGVLLAKWLGSWLWALLLLCVLQLLILIGAVTLFRRCMHWLTLPATRGEFRHVLADTWHAGERSKHDAHVPEAESGGERKS